MSGVSVAEKRARLEAAGEEWPVCDCHGKPKKWSKDDRSKQGGSWLCSEKEREKDSRYRQSEKGREKVRRYWQGEKGREAQRRYLQSEKGREAQRKKRRRYYQSGKAREAQRRYYHKKLLLELLPDRPHIIEMSLSKEVAIARLALGGSTKAERENANRKLEQLLVKEKKEWLSPLIINCAMRTTRRVASSPLCLESSPGD